MRVGWERFNHFQIIMARLLRHSGIFATEGPAVAKRTNKSGGEIALPAASSLTEGLLLELQVSRCCVATAASSWVGSPMACSFLVRGQHIACHCEPRLIILKWHGAMPEIGWENDKLAKLWRHDPAGQQGDGQINRWHTKGQ